MSNQGGDRGQGRGEGGRRDRDTPLDGLLRALYHPTRRQIMSDLIGATGGAKVVSGRLGIPIANASYHLNRVLAEQCKVVELVEVNQRRGAQEKVYRLDEARIAAGIESIPAPLAAYLGSWACPGGRG